PAVQLEFDHLGGRGLQSLRERRAGASGGALDRQHGDYRIGARAGAASCRRKHGGAGGDRVSGALRLERLSKRYAGGGEAALEALDLTIDEGAFVTLLGPSGCGKTTTLRLIAGYMAPDQGRIRLGERLLSAPDRVLPPEQRGMGMVFQNYAVWPHKTVFENVVFGLRLRKVAAAEARRRVEAMLALTHLEGLEQRFPSELSG